MSGGARILHRWGIATVLVGCTPADPPGTPPEPTETGAPTSATGDTATTTTGSAHPPLTEFDGQAPNGVWVRAEPIPVAFPFEVSPDALVMTAASGGNQHLVREGFVVDAGRPYRVAASFTIDSDHDGINAFAVHVAVGGPDGDPTPISCWSVNLDLSGAAGESGGAMKLMGFADGGFEGLDSVSVPDARAGVAYRLQVDVHHDGAGGYASGEVQAELVPAAGGAALATWSGSYAPHPWQPDAGAAVRIGFDSHAADWTVTELEVRYLDEP